MDNHVRHQNGRIWFIWRKDEWEVKTISRSDQSIHCELYHLNGEKAFNLTLIYAHNKLIHRSLLWYDIESITKNVKGPWMLIGDFNNVLIGLDRVEESMCTLLNTQTWLI